MKVIHVNFAGSLGGGAGIAAYRLHEAMNESCGLLESEFWSAIPDPHGKTRCFRPSRLQKIDTLKNILLFKLLKRPVRSLNLFRSKLVDLLNQSDADVINLHWINGEMVSIEELGRLRKPVVWTMHDMWAFCGAEHYTHTKRYLDGYAKAGFSKTKTFELEGLKGLLTYADIDRWTYLRKQRSWSMLKLHVVTPSRWLSHCVAQSTLLGHVPVSTIPNCLDIRSFCPLEKRDEYRARFGFPLDKKVILFGAMDSGVSRKGGDLLLAALQHLKHPERHALAVFGAHNGQIAGIETVNVGRIQNMQTMVELYNAADVMCVPSRQDNLPNTCIEAHACGLPIVAFDVGGISDIVQHRKTGYLARPFEITDFYRGIEWILSDAELSEAGLTSDRLGRNAREKAEQCFSPEQVVRLYRNVYSNLAGRN